MEEVVTVNEFLEASNEAVVQRLSLICDPDRIKFSNRGFVATTLAPSEVSTEGSVYRGRQVKAVDFFKPVLLADELWNIAAKIGSETYSVSSSNCHHFALDLWNSLVVEKHQCHSYPDRLKSGVLHGAQSLNLDKLGSAMVNNDLFCADMPSDDDDLEADLESGWRTTLQRDGDGRCSGVLSVPRSHRPGYNRLGRLQDFARLLEAGTVYILQSGSDSVLTQLQPPEGIVCIEDEKCEVWAEQWLQNAGGAGKRLAERITGIDTASLMLRLPEDRLTASVEESEKKTKKDAERVDKLFSSLDFSRKKMDLIQDLCFVALQSTDQLRLAIYAILRPLSNVAENPLRRLRLLSGDANCNEEGTFTYAICNLPPQPEAANWTQLRAPQPLATEELQKEVASLQTALSTGDWGFVTLL